MIVLSYELLHLLSIALSSFYTNPYFNQETITRPIALMAQQQDTRASPVQGLMITEEMIIQRFERRLQVFGREKAIELYEDYQRVLSGFPGWESTLWKLEEILLEEQNERNKAREPGILPKELSTPTALELWTKLETTGFVDKKQQPVNLSRAQCAILADIIGEKRNLKYRWKPFEILWNIKNLRTDNYKSFDQNQESTFRDKIKQALL